MKPDQRWSMDFVSDAPADGRVFRTLNLVDDFTRESVAIEVDTSMGGSRVVRVLERLAAQRGLPASIVMDNGPEFTGKALDAWAHASGVKLHFIRPGKPVENAYAESFNGRFRDECLNENWFTNLLDARTTIETWRRHYNEERPHRLRQPAALPSGATCMNCRSISRSSSRRSAARSADAPPARRRRGGCG